MVNPMPAEDLEMAVADGTAADTDIGENILCESPNIAIKQRYGISSQLVRNCPPSDIKEVDVLITLGVHKTEEKEVREVVPYAGYVMSTLKKNSMPTGEIFDLAPRSPLFDRSRRQCDIIPWSGHLPRSPPGSDWYQIVPLASSSEDWILIVPSPITALEIQRRGWGQTVTDIARELVRRGIQFRTFRYILHLHPNVSVQNRGLGVYPLGYSPTIDDYREYELRRNAFLQRDSARVALTMGGIVWRLAVDALGLDVEWTGLSCARSEDDLLRTPHGMYFEDSLTEDEIAIVCGVYYTLTST